MSWAFLAHYSGGPTCGSFLWFARAKIGVVVDLISDALPFDRLWY